VWRQYQETIQGSVFPLFVSLPCVGSQLIVWAPTRARHRENEAPPQRPRHLGYAPRPLAPPQITSPPPPFAPTPLCPHPHSLLAPPPWRPPATSSSRVRPPPLGPTPLGALSDLVISG